MQNQPPAPSRQPIRQPRMTARQWQHHLFSHYGIQRPLWSDEWNEPKQRRTR